MTPSLSSSSDGSPKRGSQQRASSPFKSLSVDTSIHNNCNGSNSPSFMTPSPVVRRTLTYSPTKRSNTWSQRIIFVLLGLIFVSVLLTMVCTILLMDDNDESKQGMSFWAPHRITIKSDAANHPWIRGGKEGIVPMTNTKTNLTKFLSTERLVGDEPENLDANDIVVSALKDGDKQVVVNEKDASETSLAHDSDQVVVVASDKAINDSSVHDLVVLDGDAPKDPNVNGKGLEDHLEEIPDVHPDKLQKIDDADEAAGDESRKSDPSNDKEPDKDDHATSPDLDPQQEETKEIPKPEMYPRVVFYDAEEPPPVRTDREMADDPMLHAPPGFEAAPQDRMKPDYTQGECVPMHDWQTKSFPICNLVHEYDLKAAGAGIYKNNTNLVLEDNISFLGQGWFRQAWRLNAGSSGESVVLKTLRLEREFYDEYYDLHRRDAVAMERLTHSPFIMDIYGYCGQSALNEMAEFGNGALASLEKVDRRMRGNDDASANLLKLQLGASVAVGVAHIHEIDDDDRPSMVHYDLNPRNVAIVGAGKPKINDFNIAEFLHWNPRTNETCGFPSRLHEPWWRAPEEVSLEHDNRTVTSEVDVWALGSILFHVLTTHSPRGKMKKERAEEVRAKVLRGEPPFLDSKYTSSKDPAVVAFREAMQLCFVADPKKRGTARQVADVLLKTLMDEKKKRKARIAKKGH